MNARPITWPTVPKGKDRVRVCLHAGNTKDDIQRLVNGIVKWAEDTLQVQKEETRTGVLDALFSRDSIGGIIESKL
jgi:8-amino-7-oxononanoate synthase